MLGLPLLALLVTASPDPKLLRAIELYEGVEFTKADELLKSVVADPAVDKADQVTAWKYLAALHLAQGKTAEADQALTELVKLDPTAKLDPTMFDPALIARHDALVATLPKETSAVVQSPPPPNEVKPPIVEQPVASAPIARPSKILPIIAIAAGTGLQAFGVYTLGNIVARSNEFEAAQRRGEPAPFPRAVAVGDRQMHPISIAATAVGLLLTGYGVYSLVSAAQPAQLSLIGGADGAGVAFSGSF